MRIRLKAENKVIESSALVNSGFEAEDPEIVLPPSLAEVLGVEPSNEVSSYNVAGGGTISALRGNKPLGVEIVLEDRSSHAVKALPSIMPGENEVIISDRLAHDLGIVILDPYSGDWCLRDELGRNVRKSVKPEYWS